MPSNSAPLLLYRFDEGEGAIVQDASGRGHVGLIIGAQWVVEIQPN